MNAKETSNISVASTTDHRSNPTTCHEQVASRDDLGAATARRSSINDGRIKAPVNKLGSVALVVAVSILTALVSSIRTDSPRAAATLDDSSNQLGRLDDEMTLRGLVRGEGALYFEYELPPGGEYCHSEEFDPCHDGSPMELHDEWMEKVPGECADKYEEAGFYTSNKGVKIAENEFIENALIHMEMYKEGSIAKNCAGYYFIKIRACVPNGSSCFPNGKLEIRQDTYYNLEAQYLGHLGSHTGLGDKKEWKHVYNRPFYPDAVDYYRGPFYPDNEYDFHPSDEGFKETNQWRFVKAPGSSQYSPLYYLINRWTGQYMGSGNKRHNGNINDQVGKSKLFPADAVTVSIDSECDRHGTVQISATDEGKFRYGMTENLFFTSNDPDPEYTEHVGGGCYWQASHPPCPEGQEFIRWNNNGCFIGFYRRVCKEYHAKPEFQNKRPLQFYIKEVTNQIEPINSAKNDATPVLINTDRANDPSQVALDSIAPKFGIEKSKDAFEWFINNAGWQPFGKALPPANLRFRGAAKAVVIAQRMKGSLGKSTGATSTVNRLLNFANLGGPHVAIITGFATAAIDFKAATGDESRFQAIENRLNEIVDYVDAKIEDVIKLVGNYALLREYQEMYQKTYLNYHRELADIRPSAFSDLDFNRTYNDQRGEAYTWIAQLANIKRDFHGLYLEEIFGLGLHEVVDFYMDAYPTIVATYITIVEEIVSLKAVLGTANSNSCEDHVIIEFGSGTDKLVEMKEKLQEFETTVRNYRLGETKGLPVVVPKKMYEVLYCPDPEDPTCEDFRLHDITYTFYNVTETDQLLLSVPKYEKAIYDRVIRLRHNEIRWTFDNFGKYNLEVMYQAIDNAKSSIVSTCEELKSNSTYAAEFVEFGKKDHFSLAFDEDRATCSDRQKVTLIDTLID